MASPPQKISLYDLSALKAQTDDMIPTVLTSLRPPYTFTPSHYYTNVRLVLGYSAVLIAALLFIADYRLGWSATKAWTLPACVAYFVLNTALTGWIWIAEKGKIFVGRREGGQTITLTSSGRKFSPTYTLHISYTAPSGHPFQVPSPTVSVPYTDLFNMHGFLDRKALRRWLAGNIEVVGLGDPDAKKEWEDMEREKKDMGEVEEEIVSQGAARVGAINVTTAANAAAMGNSADINGGARKRRAG